MTTSTKTTAKAVKTTKTAVLNSYKEFMEAEKTAKTKYVIFAKTTCAYYAESIVADKKVKDNKKALKGLLEECGLKHPHTSEWIAVINFLCEKVKTAKKIEACLKANSFKATLEIARRASSGGVWKLDKNYVLVKVEESATTTTKSGGKQTTKSDTTTTKSGGKQQTQEQANHVTSVEVTKDLETLDSLFNELDNVNLSLCAAETLTKYAKILTKIQNHISDVARQKKYTIRAA